MISALLGGIGLFLLGMSMMSEGLKAAAGGALRDVLARYTGGPLRALASGAALTALIQSSSATTVMTIGFVSAGLLTFNQAIGVIFGAVIGTTSTAWMVAFLGLKYSVSIIALPLVGIGAFLHLLGRGRARPIGFVLAGFGLIFVGIDTLQAGMLALSERVDFAGISGGDFGGRILLVLIGAAMTVVMQSSSAAVATTLAAVHAGTIDINQAAALVVGQNLGTTVTAVLASIGASVPAKRTAAAHVVLNGFSGAVALLALPLYLLLMAWAQEVGGFTAAEQIALFHTAFNVVGVGLLLPHSDRLAGLVSRVIVEPGHSATRFLDDSVRSVPAVAVEAARRTVVEIVGEVVAVSRSVLSRESLRGPDRERVRSASQGLTGVRTFLAGVRTSADVEADYQRHLSVLHAVDHIERLIEALDESPGQGWKSGDVVLDGASSEASDGLLPTLEWLEAGAATLPAPELELVSRSIAERRRTYRTDVMAWTAAGDVSPQQGLGSLDTMRWIDRIVYHVWRATYHLALGDGDGLSPSGTFRDAPVTGQVNAGVRDRDVE